MCTRNIALRQSRSGNLLRCQSTRNHLVAERCAEWLNRFHGSLHLSRVTSASATCRPTISPPSCDTFEDRFCDKLWIYFITKQLTSTAELTTKYKTSAINRIYWCGVGLIARPSVSMLQMALEPNRYSSSKDNLSEVFFDYVRAGSTRIMTCLLGFADVACRYFYNDYKQLNCCF